MKNFVPCVHNDDDGTIELSSRHQQSHRRIGEKISSRLVFDHSLLHNWCYRRRVAAPSPSHHQVIVPPLRLRPSRSAVAVDTASLLSNHKVAAIAGCCAVTIGDGKPKSRLYFRSHVPNAIVITPTGSGATTRSSFPPRALRSHVLVHTVRDE